MSFEWRRYMKLSRVILKGLNMGYLTTKHLDRTRVQTGHAVDLEM